MIKIKDEMIQDIPVLHVVNDADQHSPLPVVTYIHGFTSAKENNLPFAYLLAKKGYRVLLPDCLEHGERASGKTPFEMELEFWNVVKQNLKEMTILKNDMEKRGLIKDQRFGLAGTSMGGITTSSALTQFSWIKAAAVLMGSPKTMEMAQYTINQVEKNGTNLPFSEVELQKQIQSLEPIDLSQHMDKLNNRPLLFWHGDQDPTVPFKHSESFYHQALEQYQDKERLHFIPEKNRGHKVSRAAILAAVNWFEKYL
ncbi:esterase [Virgibacillus sp. MSP4-1]|uniref:esterase n=1 Tax=Virgibacillus sp. MSP4-1 TaxID=2700081 RepID=UPI0003A0E31D|nr:esterase [Virgibacillus sp. MSP4-1]QHS21666.1 esterase [Virgibacillus sp. MSP4-1]